MRAGPDQKKLDFLAALAAKRVPADVAWDVAMIAAERITKARPNWTVNRRYMSLAVRSAAADWYENQWKHGLALREFGAIQIEPRIEDEPEFQEIVSRASQRTQALIANKAPPNDGSPAGALPRAEHARWRKARSRSLQRIKSELTAQWISEGQPAKLNKYRPGDAVCQRTAMLLAQRNIGPGVIEDVFAARELNRAIQTATWTYVHLGRLRPEHAQRCWGFLSRQLSARRLFRGNLTYITEALLEADILAGAEAYRHLYLPHLQDMDSRVSRSGIDPRAEPAVAERCIYDVKQVRRLGDHVPLADVRTVLDDFKRGMADVDLHRSLAFVLLRTRPDDSGGLDEVVGSLRGEIDQTNAYYVTRYVMQWGLKEAPRLLRSDTLTSLRAVSRRWPQNHYFRESASRFRAKLIKSGVPVDS